MSDQFPVTVSVRRTDGTTEQVRVGTATKTAEGFSLKLGELSIGGQADAARPAYSSAGPAPVGPGGAPLTLPNYGRAKGAPIAGASLQDLEYYANGAKRSLNDPGKARWHDKEKQLLAAIEAEMAKQGFGGGPPMAESGPEAQDDGDIPF